MESETDAKVSTAQQIPTSSRDRSSKNGAFSGVRAHKPRRTAFVLQALNAWGQRPFRYGQADCCQLAAFVVDYLTGKDYSAAFEYHSKAQADALIAGHGSLSELVSSVLGPPVPKAELRPGDPVLLDVGGVGALMVYLGTENVAGLDLSGRIQRYPLRFCRWGWRT